MQPICLLRTLKDAHTSGQHLKLQKVSVCHISVYCIFIHFEHCLMSPFVYAFQKRVDLHFVDHLL